MNEKQMDRLDSEAREQRAASELAPSEIAGPVGSLSTGELFGELTHAGTMTVGEDQDVTGLFVSITVEELRAVKYLPMYRRVLIVTASDWNERIAERDHLVGALRCIERLWRTHAEACADNSAVAEMLAKTATGALAYLSSPNNRNLPADEKRHD